MLILSKTQSAVNSILETISYSDYFDYPLKIDEIHRNLSMKISLNELTELLERDSELDNLLSHQDGYYFLKGREETITIRREREAVSTRRWKEMRPVLHVLQHIPFVKMIFVTGSLSVNNSHKHSDIDFLVVTQPKRVWLTRMILFFVEKYFSTRLSPEIHFCFNFIIGDNQLPQSPSNIYIAREIVQMQPVRGGSWYHSFFDQNSWLPSLMPNINIEDHLEDSLHREQALNLAKSPSLINGISKFSQFGFFGKLLDKLNYLEFRRATDKLYRNFQINPESVFSIDQYKAHFNNHQQRIIDHLELDDSLGAGMR